jgi:fimbrial chaperone protein
MQVQQRAWVQRNGRDEQDETRDLIISPAIFTFKPGEAQVVRIALRGAPDRQLERAYRILVSEIPGPSVPTAPELISFRIALRMDLPLFVAAIEPGAPSPSFEFEPANGRLLVRNEGPSHIRFTDFTLQQAGRQLHAVPVFTVLPGSAIAMELPRVDRATTVANARVEADSNAGPISRDVVPR